MVLYTNKYWFSMQYTEMTSTQKELTSWIITLKVTFKWFGWSHFDYCYKRIIILQRKQKEWHVLRLVSHIHYYILLKSFQFITLDLYVKFEHYFNINSNQYLVKYDLSFGTYHKDDSWLRSLFYDNDGIVICIITNQATKIKWSTVYTISLSTLN